MATAAGDVEAFRRLFDRYVGPLFRFALSRLGDRGLAEDAVQETFAAAWKGAGAFAGRSRVSTWLYGICRHTIAKASSRRLTAEIGMDSPSRFEDGSVPQDVVRDQVDEASGVEQRVDVEEALKELSPRHKEVVVLALVNGLPLGEVAQLTGVPVGTVKSRLHWARIYLAGRLAGERVGSGRGEGGRTWR